MALNPLAVKQDDPLAGTLNPPPGVFAGQPRQQTPLAQPAALSIPTLQTLTAPKTPQFTGTAPKATPFGDFTAPNPADVANDPGYQFEQSEGMKAIQRAQAANGQLNSPNTWKSLARFTQGLASTHAGQQFDRALSAYGANRATNQQNYGQQTDQFGNDLNAFNTNAGVGLNYGRLGLDTTQENNANLWKTAGADQANRQATNDYTADEGQRVADNNYRQQQASAQQQQMADYQQQVEDARRALSVQQQPPVVGGGLSAKLPWQTRVLR